MNSIKEFWMLQNNSLNRTNSIKFYKKKALEHRSILSDDDATADILDLGCGAGELLEQLLSVANITVALDFSESMICAARKRLGSQFKVDLINKDIFEYLPSATHAVWTTTGALNQYLNSADLNRVLLIFAENKKASAFYLFDCIDPLRFRLLYEGISYRADHLKTCSTFFSKLKRFARRMYTAIQFASCGFNQPVAYLGSSGMGYGQRPDYWLSQCSLNNLHVEIVSSRYYEYRFHVIIRKGILK